MERLPRSEVAAAAGAVVRMERHRQAHLGEPPQDEARQRYIDLIESLE